VFTLLINLNWNWKVNWPITMDDFTAPLIVEQEGSNNEICGNFTF
jgi:hypothetical protein